MWRRRTKLVSLGLAFVLAHLRTLFFPPPPLSSSASCPFPALSLSLSAVSSLSALQEWCAASLPFFYFLPWSFQVNWLWKLACGDEADTASAGDTLISLPNSSAPVSCVQATQGSLAGNSVRVASAASS
ncbi:unnamed protein product [Prorocentrum cordatum]|uniref:Secreted protein n=1 Tax=Prorocentrum cordatum TaxID=2364126 RepID=A0ABN9XJV7_9DINO|nr:unnamed protein product [Polarella glacialis]